MPDAHSRFSASNFAADAACPGRQVVEGRGRLKARDLEEQWGFKARPERPNYDAALGTAAHTLLLDRCVPLGVDPAEFLGEVMVVDGFQLVADEDMCGYVRTAARNIAALTEGADLVETEVRVNYAPALKVDEQDGWGTADLIAIWNDPPRLLVYDYKNGRGVQVDVEESLQARLYAAGAYLRHFEGLVPSTVNITLVIDQPKVFGGEPQIYEMTAWDLFEWVHAEARPAAAQIYEAESLATVRGVNLSVWAAEWLRPSETACRWCGFKGQCPSLAQDLQSTVVTAAAALPEEFEDLSDAVEQGLEEVVAAPFGSAEALAAGLRIAGRLEELAKAYRATAESALLAGETVPGYKLVQGKKGARAWANVDEAEAMLTKTFRLKVDEAYNKTLISPTQAEKVLGPRRWAKVQDLIVRAEGEPSVAPESDKRPALVIRPVIDDFEEVTEEELA